MEQSEISQRTELPKQTIGLSQLPDELLEQIFSFLPLQDLVASERLCRSINNLVRSHPIYASHCIDRYRFWHPKHNIKTRLRAPLGETPWRQILIERRRGEQHVKQEFEDLLDSQLGQIERSSTIASYGYDAKDFLLEQFHIPKEADDYLSRIWWAQTLLAHIERYVALHELLKLRKNKRSLTLERALACVDLLVVQRPPETLDEVEEHLDRIATSFKDSISTPSEYRSRISAREKALLLVKYLREHNLLGIYYDVPSREYHRLQNTLISVALCERNHHSLPLVSAALYCAIASRVGVNASLINYPAHIYVVVRPTTHVQLDLDGERLSRPRSGDETLRSDISMYLDPYNSAEETSHQMLQAGLMRMHFPEATRRECLAPIEDVESILTRTGNNMGHVTESMETCFSNILADVDRHSGFVPQSVLDTIDQIRPVEIGDRHITERSRITLRISALTDDEVNSHLPDLKDAAFNFMQVRYFSLPIVRDLIMPLLESSAAGPGDFKEQLREHGLSDYVLVPKRRADISNISQNRRQHPAYTIGTYFEHKKYGYKGIIIGWDSTCDMSENWIQQMQVDTLSRGRHQPFYNILDQSTGNRYVAEDNIGPLGTCHGSKNFGPADTKIVPHENLMRRAGEYMRRWDAEREIFVSNLRDEYPDD